MHIPERMCVACRQMKPKNELIRIVKSGDTVEIDESGRKNGRGAYICKNNDCIKSAKNRHALSKHFKTALDESLYDDISEALKNE